MKLNQPVVGFLVGLLAPVLGFLIVYMLLGRSQSFHNFWYGMTHDHRLAAKVISLSLLANLIPFALTNRRYYYFAKGIFIISMLYALLIVLLRYVWN